MIQSMSNMAAMSAVRCRGASFVYFFNLLLLMLITSRSWAVTFSLGSSPSVTISEGETTSLDILLDSEGQTLDTFNFTITETGGQPFTASTDLSSNISCAVTLPSVGATFDCANESALTGIGTITITFSNLAPGTSNFSIALIGEIIDISVDSATLLFDATVSEPTPLGAPENLTATPNVSAGLVFLDWDPPSGATASDILAYFIERAEVVNGDIGSTGFVPLAETDGSVTQFNDTDVAEGQTFAYQVIALDASESLSAPSTTAIASLTSEIFGEVTEDTVEDAINDFCEAPTDAAVSAVCDAVADLSVAEQIELADEINIDEIKSFINTSFEVVQTQVGNLQGRINSLKAGASGISLNGLTSQVGGYQIPLGQIAQIEWLNNLTGSESGDNSPGKLGIFASGRLDFGDQDQTGNEQGYDFSTYGITVGIDYRFRPDLVAGTAFGFSETDVDFDEGAGGQDNNSWSVSWYGSYYPAQQVFIDGLIVLGQTDFDNLRIIDVGSIRESVVSDTEGDQFAVAINSGYNIQHRATTLTPFLRLEFIQTDIESFTESGSVFALDVGSQSNESFTTNLGGSVSHAISHRYGVTIPQLSFDWEHEFKDDEEFITASFVLDPDANFVIETDDPDRNYFNIGFSLTNVFKRGASLYATFDSELGRSDNQSFSVQVGGRLEF